MSNIGCVSRYRLWLIPLLLTQNIIHAQDVQEIVTQCIENRLTAKEMLDLATSEGSERFLSSKGDSDGESLDEEEAGIFWAWTTAWEWERLANITLGVTSDNSTIYSSGVTTDLTPFLFCSRKYNSSGYERFLELRDMLLNVDPSVDSYLTDPNKTQVLSNNDELSCAITRIPAYVAGQACFTEEAQRPNDLYPQKLDVVIQPLVSLMKLTTGSLKRLEQAFDYDGMSNGGENNDNENNGDGNNRNGNNGGGNNGGGGDSDGNYGDGNNSGSEQRGGNNAGGTEDGNTDGANGGGNSGGKDSANSRANNGNKKGWAEKEANNNLLVPLIQVQFCVGAIDFTVDGQGNTIENDQIAVLKGEQLQNALLDRSLEGSNRAAQNVLGALFNSVNGQGVTSVQDLPEGQQKYRDKMLKKKSFWDNIYRSYNKSDTTERELCDRMIRASNFTADAATSIITIEIKRNYTIYNNETGEIEQTGEFDKNDAEIQKLCAMALVSTLTGIDEVCSVDVQTDINIENTISAYLQQTGIRDVTPFYDVGLNGEGQVVSVSDTGLDVNNCYFKDSVRSPLNSGSVDLGQRKVVQYVPFVDRSDAPGGHGTHVCGTLVGNKATDGVTEEAGMATGIAKSAKLAFFDIGHPDGSLSVPIPVDRIFAQTALSGAKLHSASWGSDINAYGFNARGFDRYIYENDDYLIMVAAGNAGTGSTFRTVGDPATAKNIISVGAANSDEADLSRGQLGPAYVADFSSRGPTFDGRTKPDVMAPGKFILSANAGGFCDPSIRPSAGGFADGVMSLSGTSMATPGVTGSVAIIRQYFIEGWYPDGIKNQTNSFVPSAALLKAVIMNGAQPLAGVDNGNRGIENSVMYDQIQNMGLVSYVNSIYLPTVSNVKLKIWDRESVRQGTSKDYFVTIDKSGGCMAPNLSVMLVWTDMPSQPGCVNCLINDLDLLVENNSTSKQFFPNGLSGPDRTNNAERVRLEASDQEVYKITVTGHNLVFGEQRYALVATGCFGNPASSLDFSSSSFNDTGASLTTKIIVGIVCGAVGVALIGGVTWFVQRRRQHKNP